jgi:hypothetical protein
MKRSTVIAGLTGAAVVGAAGLTAYFNRGPSCEEMDAAETKTMDRLIDEFHQKTGIAVIVTDIGDARQVRLHIEDMDEHMINDAFLDALPVYKYQFRDIVQRTSDFAKAHECPPPILSNNTSGSLVGVINELQFHLRDIISAHPQLFRHLSPIHQWEYGVVTTPPADAEGPEQKL